MRTVGVRSLKDNLSEYIAAAEAGETVLVTHHRRVVACIGPPPGANAPPATAELALERLVAAGGVRRGRGDFRSWLAPGQEDARFAQCRALDAIHAATALHVQEVGGFPVKVATFDARLASFVRSLSIALA